MKTPDLSGLVSARLCHDLISPMGAIGNGLELLQMTAEGRGAAELALITDSLGTALAKLRFYRLAFGPADTLARQSFDEARQITDTMFHGRFTVSWREQPGTVMTRAMAQIAYLSILCFERSMPMGGEVVVTVEGDAVTLRAEGCRIGGPADLWLHVTKGHPAPELRSDGVQFALLRRTVEANGYGVEREFTETTADLRLHAPAMRAAISA